VENKNFKGTFSKQQNKETEREVKKLSFSPEKDIEDQKSEDSEDLPQSNIRNKYFNNGNKKNEKNKKNSSENKKVYFPFLI
jgi:hypothetical protein